MESKKPEEEQKQKTEYAFVENSKKRKRRELKGPSGYGIKLNNKKRNINGTNDENANKNETPANTFKLKEFQEKLLNESERTLEELVSNNKAFFEQHKQEDQLEKVQKDIKDQYFGNQEKYYRYRLMEKWQDSRVDQMKPAWFQDRKILDIGCNEGIVDLLIAAKFQPKLVIGIDIDHRMIKGAINNMQKVINDQQQMDVLLDEIRKQNEKPEDVEMLTAIEEKQKKAFKEKEEKLKSILSRIEQLPISLQLSLQGELNQMGKDPRFLLKAIQEQGKDYKPSPKDLKNYLYGKVCFRTENFISNCKDLKEKYDTIICWSTIKYVHLNFGDVGIKALFLKSYELLENNGLFVIEPQPWKSYKKKKKMSDRIKEVYSTIQLRPHLFKEYLERIGFEHLDTITPSLESIKKGYDRPIIVFRKTKK